MFKIDGQEIFLTRGDSATISFDIKDGETTYDLNTGDKVYFRMALKAGKSPVALTKECEIDVEHGKAILSLAPDDTANLQFKIYRYEVELVTTEDAHYTFIADQSFAVGTEIELHD